MFRVRFHGRGGQGIKTASRVLGSAFFREGFEVQDAPRYGAERRGAPIFAYVRADRGPIYERGVIVTPDLVAVTDDTLLGLPAAGVLQGLDAGSALLVASSEPEERWRDRLGLAGPVRALPVGSAGRIASLTLAGAAARWVGVISRVRLMDAVRDELGPLGDWALDEGLRAAGEGYDRLAVDAPLMPRDGPSAPAPGRAGGPQVPAVVGVRPETAPIWIHLEAAGGKAALPTIYRGGNARMIETGLWRTLRPVVARDRCRGCWWVCAHFCPDGAIGVDEDKRPTIDLDHCKGCGICMVQCPHHAIDLIAEPSGGGEEARR